MEVFVILCYFGLVVVNVNRFSMDILECYNPIEVVLFCMLICTVLSYDSWHNNQLSFIIYCCACNGTYWFQNLDARYTVESWFVAT